MNNRRKPATYFVREDSITFAADDTLREYLYTCPSCGDADCTAITRKGGCDD